MSGGVDSSVAAALLAEQGHDVIGLSMQLYDQSGTQPFGSCCTLDDLHDARRVASALGFPHYIVNFERQFQRHGDLELRQRVRRPAARRFLRALQQRPEVLDAARPRARARRRTIVATGHYARVEQAADGRWLLQRSARPRQGPVVLPVLADAGATRARRVSRSARCSKPEVRAEARRSGCWSPTSRTARRSASCPTATTRRSSRVARRRRSRPARSSTSSGEQLGHACGRAPLHHRPAQGPRRRGTDAALRAEDRRRLRRRHRRAAFGARARDASPRRA